MDLLENLRTSGFYKQCHNIFKTVIGNYQALDNFDGLQYSFGYQEGETKEAFSHLQSFDNKY